MVSSGLSVSRVLGPETARAIEKGAEGSATEQQTTEEGDNTLERMSVSAA